MTQTPLTRDLIADPELWRLSMMICVDGVEVVMRRVTGEPELLTSSLKYDAGAQSSAAALEELVYANPLLLAQFGKVDIVLRTTAFQILPPEVAHDADAVEALLDMLPHPDGRPVAYVSEIDDRNSVVNFVDKGVANFLARTFFAVDPVSHLSVFGQYFTHQSRLGNSGKMYVNISEKYMDILAFNSLGLSIANTYVCTDDDNAAYYVLAAARAVGFDFTADELLISGNVERRATLMTTLRKFANYVMPTIFPATAYRGDRNALRAPFELIVLPLCE